MNLVEIMIVIAIMVALIGVTVPVLSWSLRLGHKDAASKLTAVYERLNDEAMMRNVTFRIAYHLEERYYEVEVSPDAALLFDDPDKRAEFEAALQEKMERKASRFASEDDGVAVDEAGLAIEDADFTKLQEKFLKRFDLPGGVVFGGVYTPAYGEMVEPNPGNPEDLDDDEKTVVYSYILPSGISEHTVVTLVQEGNPNYGYTVEVEPMTGIVHVAREIRDFRDRFDFVPDEGPDLSQ